MESPHSFGLRIPCCNLPSVLYQHRLLNSPKRNQLLGYRFGLDVILRYYRMSCLAPSLRRAFASTTMVTREIWFGNQHWCPLICCSVVVLLLLAARHTGDSCKHELVIDDVWGHHCVRINMVCREGTSCIHWACRADEARRLGTQQTQRVNNMP